MLFRTEFQGYSVKFSPFLEGRLAVSTSQNFGIIGNGKQMIFDLSPQASFCLALQPSERDALSNSRVMLPHTGHDARRLVRHPRRHLRLLLERDQREHPRLCLR